MYKNIHPFLDEKRVSASLLKRRIYYREQSGKGFKARLTVTEKDLEKYLESWDPDGDLLGFFSNVFMMSLPGAYSFSNRCNVNKRNYTKEIITLCV